MTQNPYATPSQPHQPFGSDPWLDTPADQRVSVLAVVSLVCGILCFIPVVGTIGVVLGIASLFLIAGSQRRLTGKGLAIAGIVLGMLGTVAWGGIVIGFSQMATIAGRDVVVPAAGAMTLIESGKSDELKKYFAPDVAARLTPE
ncbi:MAG: DUF4190 domain-containing protein, partial [Phycisphaerales bacterium]|nr:DUF4190 domain-containing protein [Phycisphaerales bacterium]